jgi:hypothetical protein
LFTEEFFRGGQKMQSLRLGAITISLMCLLGPVSAQTTPRNPGRENIEKPPFAGANSFTEAQARDRIAKAGFNDVKILNKDEKGVWRGRAQKSGQQVGVALDYRGNVVQQ